MVLITLARVLYIGRGQSRGRMNCGVDVVLMGGTPADTDLTRPADPTSAVPFLVSDSRTRSRGGGWELQLALERRSFRSIDKYRSHETNISD